MTRVHELSVKHVYVMITSHMHMIPFEEKQHSIYTSNNSPYA